MRLSLDTFEWHDLPVQSLTLEEGAVRIAVTPFNEVTENYDLYELVLTNASKLKTSITGEIHFTALKNLEISSFDFTIEENRLSGELGIIPGNEGVWRIGFTDAIWQFDQKAA